MMCKVLKSIEISEGNIPFGHMTLVSLVVESIISTLSHAQNHRERNCIQKTQAKTS